MQCDAPLPTENVTLLLPLFDNYSHLGMLLRTDICESGTAAYCYKAGSVEHRFFFSEGQPWECDGWSSDAEFLYCQSESDLKEIVVCRGSYVKFDGQRVVSSERRIELAELVQSGTTAKILGPDVGLLRFYGWPQNLKKAGGSILEATPIVAETND
jgi:hypothetical protein